ncbi:galactose-specific lectin nattectin-like [Nothobranchius furzeri]|uniref:Galactose-specific lectin nattectin-like n=1 Tax=Nothobranchius furzeri TaxID=105023 RepID=A0A9D2Y0B6_NOTFU|nr:galactose-specific lectin nattectin-like [Nothobranchius furzeri]
MGGLLVEISASGSSTGKRPGPQLRYHSCWRELTVHYCRRRGGHLASFHSYSDLNFLRSLVHHRTRSFRNTWVGATDRVWDGVWKWTDGSWYNYSRWYPGEPNNWFGREDCLEINFRGSDRTNDEKCHARRPFICARRR